MTYQQLIQPNLSIVGEAYGCLSYAESVFGAPHIEACATDAWHNTQFKHSVEPTPDAIVPLWFSWFGTVQGVYKDWGHVAVNVPGKGIYSSPYNLPGHKVSVSIAQIESDLGAKYVGWSEDISTLRVIKGGQMLTKEDYLVGAQAAGFEWGKDFNYDPNKSLDEFVQLLQAYSAVPGLQKKVDDLTAQLQAKPAPTDGFNATDRATLNWIQKAIATVFRIN